MNNEQKRNKFVNAIRDTIDYLFVKNIIIYNIAINKI